MPSEATVQTRPDPREARRLEDAAVRIRRAERALWNPEVPAWVVFAGRYLDEPLHAADYRLLLALCYHADWQDKWGKVSLRRLADAFGLRHHKRLAESVWKLDRLGVIQAHRVQRFDGSNGSVEYRVNYRPPFAWEPPQLGDPQEDDAPIEDVPGEGQPKNQPGREAAVPSALVSFEDYLRASPGGGCHRAGDTDVTGIRTPLPLNKKIQKQPNDRAEGNEREDEKDAPRGAPSAASLDADASPRRSAPNEKRSGTAERPQEAIRVDGALRAWCAAHTPSLAPGDALKAFLAHHERKGTDLHAVDWRRAFKGWCRRAVKIEEEETGRKPVKAFDPALKGGGTLSRAFAKLNEQVDPGSDQKQRCFAVMARVWRTIGAPAWSSWFEGSLWKFEEGCVVVTLRPNQRPELVDEKIGHELAHAIRETLGHGRTYRLQRPREGA